jgi:hypothetical protein
MHASFVYNVYMKSRQIKKSVQLTIRDVPVEVKKLFWHHATAQKKSLNNVLVEALSHAAGIASEPVIYTDLDELAGLWVKDTKFDEAIAAQDQIDPLLWK